MGFAKQIIFLLFLTPLTIICQEEATISGILKGNTGQPIEGANIAIVGSTSGTISNKKGFFSLDVPAEEDIKLGITFIGYQTIVKTFYLSKGEQKMYNPILKKGVDIKEFELKEESNRSGTMIKIAPNLATKFVSSSGSFEAILKTLPGVSSNNELSSQYTVRGGNFDENLIYVNDIEIYRPFLIRSGRQEGLSFINSNMVDQVQFSAGGFEARYGDKMSSVLDVQYKEPEAFSGSATMSLQGVGIHVEGASDNHRFTHITGFRYRSNQYVLQSLDTDGDYRPSFLDLQTYLTYDISEKWEIGFLGNVARNKYNFIPSTRVTEFGTINEALQLTVYFDGQEIDQYQTYFGAISNTFKPKDNVELKFISSVYQSIEEENYDIEGGYRIDELERDFSDENFGGIKFNRGVGIFLDHARNTLDVNVFNIEHKGKRFHEKHTTFWGVKYQHETIDDKLSEWGIIDSAGFFTPKPSDSVGYVNPLVQPQQQLVLNEVLRSNATLGSNRYSGYFQRSWKTRKNAVDYTYTLGIRGNYWDLNNELIVSPRGSVSMKPNWQKDYLFRLSGGVYYQPPFYRELRDFDGTLNYDIKSQRSYQLVAGADHNFTAWNRPFKFTAELYYKYLQNVIPYELENVRIRYYATNNANAYATGADFKVNGEFVKGVESWFSMSLLKTEEDLIDDFYYNYFNSDGEQIISGFTLNNVPVDSQLIVPGNIPRPSDQRVNFGLYFQDYIPQLPHFKMHMALYYGTGLPFGPTGTRERYKATLRIPPYRRVDMGISYQLKDASTNVLPSSPLKHFENIWLSVEVFNLLQINNVISYLWIEDITARRYAVPNYLTSRQINLKLHLDF